MNQETIKVKAKKHSQLKNALLHSVIELIVIISQVGLFIERAYRLKHFDINDYNPIRVTIRIALLAITIVILIFLLVYRFFFNLTTEDTDELSNLHRYKAGYMAKYITLLVITIAICAVKNFEPILSGDFFYNISLAIMIFFLGELIENIIFIILEKFQLD